MRVKKLKWLKLMSSSTGVPFDNNHIIAKRPKSIKYKCLFSTVLTACKGSFEGGLKNKGKAQRFLKKSAELFLCF